MTSGGFYREYNRIATKMVSDLEDLRYEKRLQEIQLKTRKERTERGHLISIYELMNIMEETN